MMVRAIKQIVTIQPGGRIEVCSDELPEGCEAEVIVLVKSAEPKPSYRDMFGAGKGAYRTPDEADAFLRGERDAWER